MKILLATDGSDYSEKAARFLTRFDLTPADEIIIVHVISEMPYDDDYHAQIRHAIRKVAPRILESGAAILKDVRAKRSTFEKDGYPDTALVETARDLGADMIMMGARGVKGIKIFFLGSTTRSVAINSTVPVFVYKEPSWGSSDHLRVLFATDGSETADAAGRFLASMPFPETAELTLLHTVWSPVSDIPERFAAEIDERVRLETSEARKAESREAERVLQSAKKYLSEKFGGIQDTVRTGDPSVAILDTAREIRADVIVLGCRGLRGVRGMMGSVSRRVLSRAECSVLIGKPCASPVP